MRRGARPSQVINNFFSLATIVLVSVTLTLYVKYIVKEKPRVNSGLSCQEQTYTEDKIYSKKLLNIQNKLISQGQFVLDGAFLDSLEKETSNKLRISTIDKFFLISLNVFNNKSKETFVKIKYELIENEDINKKNAGTLITTFRTNGQVAFYMRKDFFLYNEDEIKQAVACTIKAFKHNVTRN